MNPIEITADRVTLRLITISDIDFIHDLLSLPETDEYNALGTPSNIEETKTIIGPWLDENTIEEIKNYSFIIETKEGQKPIGLFGLKLGASKYKRAEVWYKIHKANWNKGFATESLNAILDFCFEQLNLHRIEAGCAVNNIASIKVLEKVGFIREGQGRKILPLKSGWSDNYEYSILESDPRRK